MASPPTSSDYSYLTADKGPQVLASIIAVATASTVFVAARIFVRSFIKNNVQLDDYLIVLSTVRTRRQTIKFPLIVPPTNHSDTSLVVQLCAWACVGLSIGAVKWGNGRHFDLLSLEEKQGAIKYTIFAFPPGILSFSLPKFAVVSLLTRLLNPSRWHRIFLWLLAGVCQLALLGCVIILFAQCQPSAAQWDFSLTPTATCWDKWILVNYSIFAGCKLLSPWSQSGAAGLVDSTYPRVHN